MESDNEEAEFQVPITEDELLDESNTPNLVSGLQYSKSDVITEENGENFQTKVHELAKTGKIYESEVIEGEEDEESTFGDIAEEKIIERQFMLEQARIEEALNMIANLEIVMIRLSDHREILEDEAHCSQR